MLRHQRLFNAMNQQIDSGIDMLDGYNASLESVHRAVDLLDRLESGDTTAVLDAQVQFGNELVAESVSTEAVVYHVNSAQVQAVIDFLKKWIPVLLRKLREFTKQFIAWVQVQIKRVQARAEQLSQSIKAATRSEYTLHPGRTAAEQMAYATTVGHSVKEIVSEEAKGLVSASNFFCSAVKLQNSPYTGNGMSSLGLHQYALGLRYWVCFGHEVEGLDVEIRQTIEKADDAYRTLINIPTPDAAWRAAVVKATEGLSPEYQVRKQEISELLKVVANGTSSLTAEVNKVRGMITESSHALDSISRELTNEVVSEEATYLKFSVRGISLCETAASLGFRQRTAVLNSVVTLLERAMKSEA